MVTGDRDFSNKKANGGLSFILGNGYIHILQVHRKMGDRNYYMDLKNKILQEDKELTEKVQYPPNRVLKTHIQLNT